MSWHFSQALEAAYSEANFSDGARCAPSRSTSMPAGSSWPDRTTDASIPSQFGTTCEPSTGGRGGELLTWFLEASHARISAPLAPEMGWTVTGLVSGEKCGESWAKWDPDSCSWKTPQLSLFGGSETCSETWPRWGMMRAGECWALTTPADLTNATGSGLWLTPTANDAKPAGRVEVMEYRSPKRRNTVCRLRSQATEPHQIGTPLNVPWIEWLMGWPIGWTDSGALETGKFRQWLLWHGEPCCHLKAG
jgi:hypothetical protein